MTENLYIFRGYELECYLQPSNTYWGICRELGIRVRENTLEELKESFENEFIKAKYKVYLLWSCDQEDYYCTGSDVYVVKDLQELLPKLAEDIEEVERKNTIIAIEITEL